MKILIQLLGGFLKNVWGSMQTPYLTYRKIVADNPYQLLFVFLLTATYFFFISPIKLRTLHPLILSLNTTRLFSIAMVSYLGISLFLLLVGTLFGGKGKLRNVLMGWGYSLMPTLLWFFTTSIFYVLLPPPRHETLPGRIFSLLYIAFSVSLFFWKGILYYLTLRFALKLDLKRIMGVSLIFLPSLVIYSFVLYYLGVFKVPFV